MAYQSAWNCLQKEVLQDWIITPHHYNAFSVDGCVVAAASEEDLV